MGYHESPPECAKEARRARDAFRVCRNNVQELEGRLALRSKILMARGIDYAGFTKRMAQSVKKMAETEEKLGEIEQDMVELERVYRTFRTHAWEAPKG